MKVSIKLNRFNGFTTLELTSEYESDDSAPNFVKLDSNVRNSVTTVFNATASVLELAILDAADSIRAEKLRQRAENGA